MCARPAHSFIPFIFQFLFFHSFSSHSFWTVQKDFVRVHVLTDVCTFFFLKQLVSIQIKSLAGKWQIVLAWSRPKCLIVKWNWMHFQRFEQQRQILFDLIANIKRFKVIKVHLGIFRDLGGKYFYGNVCLLCLYLYIVPKRKLLLKIWIFKCCFNKSRLPGWLHSI